MKNICNIWSCTAPAWSSVYSHHMLEIYIHREETAWESLCPSPARVTPCFYWTADMVRVWSYDLVGPMTCDEWKTVWGKKLKYAEFTGWSQLVTINILCQILHVLQSSAMQNTTSSALSGSLLCFVTSPCFLLSQTCTATFSSAEPTRSGRIIQQRPDIVLLKWKNCQYVNLSIQQNLCT